MRLHRFYIENLESYSRNSKEKIKKFSISDKDLLNQWKNVFRLHKDDVVILFDGYGEEFHSVFHILTGKEAELEVVQTVENTNKACRETVLFASILKKDNFELVLEKATELGVSFIVPLLSDRTIKKEVRMDRLTRIIHESTEQSGWSKPPALHEPMTLIEALENFEDTEKIVLDEGGETFHEESLPKEKIGIFIGPEGGWSDQEKDMFNMNNISVYSLGSQTLRAETASIASLSLLLL